MIIHKAPKFFAIREAIEGGNFSWVKYFKLPS